jgi:hypothetical protein
LVSQDLRAFSVNWQPPRPMRAIAPFISSAFSRSCWACQGTAHTTLPCTTMFAFSGSACKPNSARVHKICLPSIKIRASLPIVDLLRSSGHGGFTMPSPSGLLMEIISDGVSSSAFTECNVGERGSACEPQLNTDISSPSPSWFWVKLESADCGCAAAHTGDSG